MSESKSKCQRAFGPKAIGAVIFFLLWIAQNVYVADSSSQVTKLQTALLQRSIDMNLAATYWSLFISERNREKRHPNSVALSAKIFVKYASSVLYADQCIAGKGSTEAIEAAKKARDHSRETFDGLFANTLDLSQELLKKRDASVSPATIMVTEEELEEGMIVSEGVQLERLVTHTMKYVREWEKEGLAHKDQIMLLQNTLLERESFWTFIFVVLYVIGAAFVGWGFARTIQEKPLSDSIKQA